jgi:hypothetical protein
MPQHLVSVYVTAGQLQDLPKRLWTHYNAPTSKLHYIDRWRLYIFHVCLREVCAKTIINIGAQLASARLLIASNGSKTSH